MTQILVEKAVIEQALEALEEAYAAQFEMTWFEIKPEHFTALREALSKPDIEEMTLTQIAARHEQAEQEPVALSKTERDAKRYAYMNHPDFFEVCDLDSHLYRYRVGIQPTVKKGFPKPINQCIEGYGETLEAAIDMAIAAQQPVSEPVARVIVRPFNPMDASCPTTEVKWLKEPVPGFLYAAPVRTKDLTYEEIGVVMRECKWMNMDYFARAVIAADRKKNNV